VPAGWTGGGARGPVRRMYVGVVLAAIALFVLGFSLLTAIYNLLRLLRWALRRTDRTGSR